MFQTDELKENSVRTLPVEIRTSSFYAPGKIFLAIFLSVSYLLLSKFLIGYKKDQLFLVLLFNALYFYRPATRRLILGFSIFIIYWIIFDYMKAFPNYGFSEVNIASLYHFEKEWFGISVGNEIVTPNEYFSYYSTTFLDILSGIFYLCWVPVPLIFAGMMFFKNRRLFFQFSLTFLLTNFLGFIGYYMYPAAPPWYVANYGFDFIAHTPGNTAGLARFDNLLGISIFEGLYSKSSNVFAAMPSLHAAYMLIVVFYSARNGYKWLTGVFALITLGIWFTAVYSNHHYVIDVIAGILTALTGIFLYQLFAKRTQAGRELESWLMKITAHKPLKRF
jgi:inositol phosphorylceramide synthase catalytic subunit